MLIPIWHFLTAALLFGCFPMSVHAHRGGGGGGGGGGGWRGGRGGTLENLLLTPIELLAPIETAIFALFIVFGALSLFQLGLALIFLVSRRQPDNNYRGRASFIMFMIFTLLWLLISYTLGALVYSQYGVQTINLSFGVYDVVGFSELVAPVFLYAGLLFLLFQRGAAQISRVTGMPIGVSRAGTALRIIVGVLLFIMLATNIVRTAITQPTTTNDTTAADALYRVYLGVYCILTFTIVMGSFVLWKNRDPKYSPRELFYFDFNVSIFRSFAEEIIDSLPTGDTLHLVFHIARSGCPRSIRNCHIYCYGIPVLQ